MSTLELKVFQIECANLIARRYAFFASHPDRPYKGSKPRPFFQALSALTGAGKTPILAEAVSQMRAHLVTEPIVLWMSKARSVVAQTQANFDGGKYQHLIEDFRVISIGDLTPSVISDGATPLLVMTTTGLFNNKDQSAGALNIYKRDNDVFGDTSPWDRLIERAHGGSRRPMIVVYDEGHNLSEQQTRILAELEPEAYLLASATLRLPENFHRAVIQHIESWVSDASDSEEFMELLALDTAGVASAAMFVTSAVISKKVVLAELVKKAVHFDGTTSTMERCIDDLITRRQSLEAEVARLGIGLVPKAIYVCKTNITDEGEQDDPLKPFALRNAPPIRIWRYLTETKGVAPNDIAIYANLHFAPGTKPDEVHLYSRGEGDFDEFTANNYSHIIFNLALQEGWDDPACYLAYIDKSMGSSIQVEQIIGRVLRQYDAKHYSSALLNSAHFFVRVDNQAVFEDAIDGVRRKLQQEGAPIEIDGSFGGAAVGSVDQDPKEPVEVALHHVFVDSEPAREPIADLIKRFPVFIEKDAATLGRAKKATGTVELGDLAKSTSETEWRSEGNTNAMRLRWFVSNAIRTRSNRALAVVDLQDQKFDVRVQAQSDADRAAEQTANEIVAAFYGQSELVYESHKPFTFGRMRVPRDAPRFTNGIYERYSEFNPFERQFADALDVVGDPWHRNPSNGGFSIPLLSEGDTRSFFPDFIVWSGGLAYCLDTKGGHLLTDAVSRKLFDIQEDGKSRVLVRFITKGKQTRLGGSVARDGFTVWKSIGNAITAVPVDTIREAVIACLS